MTDSRKKILCIGTVSERKNQIQIVNAVNLMNEEERKALQNVFLGEDDKGMFRKEISNANCGEALIFAGKVTLREMETYYQKAFGTITTSYNEGFGLTVIEGYSKGIPALFFSDLDSADDLYSPDVAISIKARTNKALKDAIIKFVNCNWNKNLIVDFAQRFSMKPVFDKYVDMYNEINYLNEEIIQKNKNCIFYYNLFKRYKKERTCIYELVVFISWQCFIGKQLPF